MPQTNSAQHPRTHPDVTNGLSRTERLDRLPFTKKHGKLLTGSGIGWALDAMDVGLISFVIAQLAVQWGLSPGERGLIASIGFVGMAAGAALGGLLADRIGRRQVFALTLVIYGLATGASALVGGLVALLILRFIVGLGLGAELPVASTYVSEFAPPKIRGRIIVYLEAFWAVGWVAAALIGYFVVPLSDNGWRWAFAIGAIPAAYALVVRLGLPESVRFLETKGRTQEAERTVRSFEASPPLFRVKSKAPTAEQNTDQLVGEYSPGTPPIIVKNDVTPDEVGHTPAQPRQPRVTALWAPALRARTASLWVVWFCINFSYYGAFIWIPSILIAAGHDLVSSFGFTLIITLAQLPGYVVAAWLIEAWGRRATLATFLIGSAGSAMLFGNATEVWQILAFGMSLSFFNLGAWGALYAITPEIYPTVLRGTGAGSAAAVGRLASIGAPLFVPLALGWGGQSFLFAIFAVFFVTAAFAVFPLGDTRGRSLDEIDQLQTR